MTTPCCKNLLVWLAVLVTTAAAIAEPDPIKLETKTALPNQHPFYNIVVYEEIDVTRGVIVRKQEWTQKVRVQEYVVGPNGRLYSQWHDEFRPGSKELSTRPIPTQPKHEQASNAQPSTNNSSGSWSAPKQSSLKESIPQDFPEEVKPDSSEAPIEPANKVRRPTPLIQKLPAPVKSIRWRSSESNGEADPQSLLPVLETIKASILEWQADMHGRFGLCPVDKMEAERKGELETIYVPYQIASGRIYVVKAQLDLLLYDLKHHQLEDSAGAALRILRRLQALESQLVLLTEEKDKSYGPALEQSMEQLQVLVEDWQSHKDALDEDQRTWALRWQVLSEDLAILKQRRDALSQALSPKSRAGIADLFKVLEKLEKTMGSEPWRLPFKEQQHVLDGVYASAQTLSKLYEIFASRADEDGISPKEYLPLLAALGANENLRVTAYTMLRLF